MKLQVALDRLTEEQCLLMLEEIGDLAEWIEIGTGVIKQYGMAIVARIKKDWPNAVLVADMKTCDAGRSESSQAFLAGADVTTVMAFADDRTIAESLQIADQQGKQVMVDLLGVVDLERVNRLYELGVRLFSVHRGKDMQELPEQAYTGIPMMEHLRKLSDVRFSYAGGVDEHAIARLRPYRPDVLIVGSAITGAPDRRAAALRIQGEMTG
ncbi:3-hexulose-6-phosphate synthase [Cohnella sp.]|uniref:3-hexulose-6-phosphate synthase n=1 Tax=Cohnella sp. TaxID=1883426 RepID=UPI0035648592